MAALSNLLFPDHGNVVLGLACDGTGVASGAGVEIDRHPPLVLVVIPLGKQRQLLRNTLFFRTGELRFLMEFGVGGDAERIALLHCLCMLRIGEFVTARFPRNFDAYILPQSPSCSECISIEPNTVGDLSRASAPIAKVNREGFISLPGHNPDRSVHLAAADLNLHHVAGGDTIMPRALR